MSGLIALGWYWLSLVHPFFVSMTDVQYNVRSKSLELSVRIFTDDFEKTLRKNCGCKIDLSPGANKVAMDPLVQKYITKHLGIQLNGRAVALVYKGFQQEEESTWSYFVVPDVQAVQTLHVSNSLLHDYQEQQINMIHSHINGKEQTEKLDFPNTEIDVK